MVRDGTFAHGERACVSGDARALRKSPRQLRGLAAPDQLSAEEPSPSLPQVDVIQPLLFSIEVALAELWRSWGIEPHAVVGHSMGELAAAYISGVLSLDHAACIICRRSHLLRPLSGRGAMAMVDLSLEQAQRALSGFEDRVSIAANNGMRSTVLSGDPEAIDELLARFERQEIFCRRVNVDVASHSPQMDPLCARLLDAVSGVTPHTAAVPIYSTVTGARADGPEFVPHYWVDNLRKPVLFSSAIQALLNDGCNIFIEMSPHPILLPAISQGLLHAKQSALTLPSMRRNEPGESVMLESLEASTARVIRSNGSESIPCACPPCRCRVIPGSASVSGIERTMRLGKPISPILVSVVSSMKWFGARKTRFLKIHRRLLRRREPGCCLQTAQVSRTRLPIDCRPWETGAFSYIPMIWPFIRSLRARIPLPPRNKPSQIFCLAY